MPRINLCCSSLGSAQAGFCPEGNFRADTRADRRACRSAAVRLRLLGGTAKLAVSLPGPQPRRNAEDAFGYSTALTVRFGGVVRRPRSDMLT